MTTTRQAAGQLFSAAATTALNRAAIAAAATAATAGRHRVRSGTLHPTGAPVRRDSLEAGTFEDTFFVVPAKGESDRQLRAARAALDEGRRLRRDARATGRKLTVRERAVAIMTAGAVRVFEEICTLARLCRGQVFPSYDRLAERTQLGRTTVARAIRLLELAGFLIRQRRFKKVAGDGSGSRYEQTSNVYRPLLPKAVVSLLPRWMWPPPLPIDETQREVDRQEDLQVMYGQLSRQELARATITAGPLADVLARLGASLDRAECEYR